MAAFGLFRAVLKCNSYDTNLQPLCLVPESPKLLSTRLPLESWREAPRGWKNIYSKEKATWHADIKQNNPNFCGTCARSTLKEKLAQGGLRPFEWVFFHDFSFKKAISIFASLHLPYLLRYGFQLRILPRLESSERGFNLESGRNAGSFALGKTIKLMNPKKHSLLGVSKNRGTPKIIHVYRVFHYKPSILGYHYFWIHPCRTICAICLFLYKILLDRCYFRFQKHQRNQVVTSLEGFRLQI